MARVVRNVIQVTISAECLRMSHRTITDEHGEQWEVWEVHPEVVERRLNEDRRQKSRGTPDRRQHIDIRFRMAPELRRGWLAFQSGVQRRRLAPIPDRWMELSAAQLVALVRNATPQRADTFSTGVQPPPAEQRRESGSR